MSWLSDNFPDIRRGWVIENGRYAFIVKENQLVISDPSNALKTIPVLAIRSERSGRDGA